MSEWHLLEFDKNRTILPHDIASGMTSNPERNICLSFPFKVEIEDSGEGTDKLLRAVRVHRKLTAIFLGSEASGWLMALALSSDLIFAAAHSTFSLTGLAGETLIATATAVGSRLPKAQAIQFFFEENHEAATLHQLGLITEIVTESDIAEPLKYLSSFLNTGKESAIIRLKDVWRHSSPENKIDSLTAERLEFAKCFESGAAESIAAYLKNRFKMNEK